MHGVKKDYLQRLKHPKMSFYRRVYRHSKMWDGKEPVQGKKIIVYCEQGIGDIIQFAGFFHFLKELGCHTIISCPTSLHRLFLQILYS
jgi:hypothetical protein